MATLVKEKNREKKKKGRQKRTPSPLTFANPGATTEDPVLPPPATVAKYAESAPAVPVDMPGPSTLPAPEQTTASQPVAAPQPSADRKNRPNKKNARHRHERVGIADQKAKQREPEAAPLADPSASGSAERPASPLLPKLEKLDARRALVNKKGARCTVARMRANAQIKEGVRRDMNKMKGGVRSAQWISYAEAEQMFGAEPLEMARRMRAEPDAADRVCGLREPLDNFIENTRILARKRRELALGEEARGRARDSLWSLEIKEQVSRGRCADGSPVELRARHTTAAWAAARAPAARLQHDAALQCVAADHCVYEHTVLINTLEMDEQLLEHTDNESRTRGALALLSARLDAAGAEARAPLVRWTYAVAHRLLAGYPGLGSTLVVLHHMLRQVHGVRWALPLVQHSVSGAGDVPSVFAVLETVLTCSRLHPDERPQVESEEEVWLEVETEAAADGSMAVDASARDVGCALTERDLLTLLQQLPTVDALRRLVLLRSDARGQWHFNGDPTGGQALLRAVCGARVLLDIVRQGLKLHEAYRSVCHWLCRLAHHTLHYIADLAEATRSDWSPHMEHALPSQLECAFNSGWLVLEGCPHGDMSLAYLAHMPFQLLSEQSTVATFRHLRKVAECAPSAPLISIEDSMECYHRISCVATMGQSRPYCSLTVDVATYLFQVGFLRKSAKMQCGGWARSLLARLMYSHQPLYTLMLLSIAHQNPRECVIEWDYLYALELNFWRPTAEGLRKVLQLFLDESPALLEPLVGTLQWGTSTQVSMEVQHALAQFLVEMARSLAFQKKAVPEWMYQALIDLKLHRVEWQTDLSGAPSPADSAFPDTAAAEADPATCVWTLLVTSWGHTLPLICEYGVPLLTALAKAGRCREAVHCLGYVMVVMTQSPESIEHTPSFKTLLSTILAEGQSYTALASRLLGRAPQTGQQLLEHLMRTHLLATYSQLQHGSPRPLLACWLALLTCADGWTGSPQLLALLDTALGCCRLQRHALDAAHDHLRACLPKKVPIGSPETPYLWLASLRAEHAEERAGGLWHRLLWELHAQRDGKVNVDKALEKVGGPKSAEGLAVYRAAAAVLATAPAHIVHVHLWELLFELLTDRPLDAVPEEFPPPGPLFFRGLFKSRQLAQLKRRLCETLEHHRAAGREPTAAEGEAAAGEETGSGELSPFTSPGGNTEFTAESPAGGAAEPRSSHQSLVTRRTAQSKSVLAYHEAVVRKVREYISLIEEKPNSPVRCAAISEVDSNTNFQVLDTLWILHFDRDLSNSLRSPPRPKVVHASPRKTAPWHNVVEETYIAPSAAERLVKRYQDAPRPLPLTPPAEPLRSLMPPGAVPPGSLALRIDKCLEQILSYASDFAAERAALSALERQLWELMPRLRAPRPFRTRELRGCGEQCAGRVELVVEGEEWCVNEGVERELAAARRRRSAALQALAAPRPAAAAAAARLMLILRGLESEGAACAAFDRLVACLGGRLEECPPLRDSVHSLVVALGERYISSDAARCAELVLRDSLPGGPALVNSLLEPRRLPPDRLPRLYAAILDHRRRPHLTFSHLSKFNLSAWRSESPELVEERRELITKVHGALLEYGPEPGADEMVLLELLARHLEQLIGEAELGESVARATRAAVAGRLPPFVWEHLERAVERCAGQLPVAQLKEQLECMGAQWWEVRMRAAPNCSLGGRAAHAQPVARVTQAYAHAALAVLKRARPALPMELVAVSTFKTVCEAWQPWLLAWWGERRELPEPLLPWGAGDTELATRTVDTFLATVEGILGECPGGEARLLLEVFWWSCEATWRPAGATGASVARHAHVLMTQLVRLPWTQHAWYHVSCLPKLLEVCSRDMECQMFAVVTLRATRGWLPPELDAGAASRSLAALLQVLTGLPLPPETLEDATNTLPWEQLEPEDFEPVLDEYFRTQHTIAAPAHAKASFPLVLSAATMSASMCVIATHAQYARGALAKRRALLGRWTRALGEALAAGGGGERAAAGVARVLRAVRDTCCGNRSPAALESSEECLQTSETLLGCAAMTLHAPPLSTVALKKWQEWARAAPQVMLRAALRVVSDVTAPDCFAPLSDTVLQHYLASGGTWSDALERWQNSSHLDVASHLRGGLLYAAYATIGQEVRADRASPRHYAEVVLQTLSGELVAKLPEEALLTFLFFIVRNLPLGPDVTTCGGTCPTERAEGSASDALTAEGYWELACGLLQAWAEGTRFQLLKRITLQSIDEYSDRFRSLCKVALYVVSAARVRGGACTPAQLAAFKALEKEFELIVTTKYPIKDLKLPLDISQPRVTLRQLCLPFYPEHAVLLALELDASTDDATRPH